VSIRTAVIGYGLAGKVFHAPFLAADDSYSLDVVVTGNADRAAEAARRHPGVRVVPTVDELFDAAGDLDLVVVGSPPATHADLARRAVDARLAVVVDKPLCATAAQGEALIEHAERAGVPLTVFQNRRWDGDFVTLRSLLDDGALGTVRRFESRFEWWRATEGKAWKAAATPADAGGILYDLGTHLVDQAIQLFGPVESAYAELSAHRPGAAADDDSFVSLLHRSGVRSHLWMNAMAAQVGPRFHVLGSAAAYTSWGLDPQEATLLAGGRPTDADHGRYPEPRWGRLGTDGDLRPVPTVPGDYAGFYRALADALDSGGPLPVDPRDAVAVLALIEALHRDFPVVDRSSRG
jgi:scyllo-inositol 2-dehydrogenase (NADP+)